MQFRKLLSLIFLVVPAVMSAQLTTRENATYEGDSLYREDQIYIGVTYNFLVNKPSGLINRGFSGGIQGGILRDLPINKRRNVAIAVGLGLAYDQFGHNLFVGGDDAGNTIFRILDENVRYDRNRFNLATVEIPVEFRWRTSTPTDYRFWRVYAGLRAGYSYWHQASFRQFGNELVRSRISEFDPWRFEGTLTVGYSTFNFYASYAFNPFFKGGNDNLNTDFNAVKVGLMFYIL